MSRIIESSRRLARARIPLSAAFAFALGACDGTNTLDPAAGATELQPAGEGLVADTLASTPAEGLSLASVSFAGGIPMGTSAQPTTQFGSRYNGGLRNIWPGSLRSELAAIKSRGGKVVLMFAGNQKYYKDGSGHFSMTKWKQRIDRFKGVNFSSFISDGTIIGHMILDEPNDPSNWNGVPVSASTVDAMGQYSKQLWPGMATIVRTEPGYFKKSPRYVDAAWAQYLWRRGNAGDYIRKQVAAAQNRGMQLVVGLNVIKGGYPNGTKMSATEVRNWGSTLLSSTYPCAFISWQYNATYLGASDMRNAMSYLRNKAENRRTKSCR